jgi:hypothetical protein
MMDHIATIPAGLILDESGYSFTGIQAPSWVEQMDSFLAGRDIRLISNPLFLTSANLGRRIGDHDLYSQWLQNAFANNPSPWWSAAFATSLLVGYFSTGKSLLDAGSIALNLLLGLSLSPKDQDFSKGKFWNAIQRTDSELYDRLLPHKPFIEQVVKWRDVAVHRMPPRVRVLTNGPPTKPPDAMTLIDVTLGIPEDPDVNPMLNLEVVAWIHPTDLVQKFGQGFHNFATEVADIIITSSQSETLLR